MRGNPLPWWITSTFKPPCDCDHYQLQYRYGRLYGPLMSGYTGNIESDKIAEIAASLTKSIMEDHQYVGSMIDLHGQTLLRKWGEIAKDAER